MWGHVTLGFCLGAGTPLRLCCARALPKGWAHPAHTWRLNSCLWVGTLQRTRGVWAVCLGAGHIPSAHVSLGHAKTQLSLAAHAAESKI